MMNRTAFRSLLLFVALSAGGSQAFSLSGCDSLSAPSTESASGSANSGSGGQGGATTPDRWQQKGDWLAEDLSGCPSKIADDDALLQLLATLSLDQTVGISYSYYELFGFGAESDPARLPYFHTLQQDISQIPCTAGNFALRADKAQESSHPLASQIADAAASLGVGVQAGGQWPLLNEDTPLLDVLQNMHATTMSTWDRTAATAQVQALGPVTRKSVAQWLTAASEAMQARDAALSNLAQGGNIQLIYERARFSMIIGPNAGLNPDYPFDLGLLASNPVQMAGLYTGAVRLAQAIDESDWSNLAAEPHAADLDVFLSTPLGSIVVRGQADHTYDPEQDERLREPIALLLDLGGNDTYRIPAGANTSAAHGVALHIDLAGDDFYGYVEKEHPKDGPGLLPADDGGRFGGNKLYGPISLSPHARQGAGVLGYGFLIDRGNGNDRYRSHRFSQGFGSLGVGVLSDEGGDDSYECEAGCQAAAINGLAILNDGAGSDSYRAFNSAQAFAGVSGSSLLYDRDGNDAYELVAREPFLFGWFEGYPNNLSRGQGAATGWRRDGKQHLGGGVALLRDYTGNDSYRAAVMAQGNGYWFGFGILADGDGNDQYDLAAYGQGSTQHFALGVFLEGGGNDKYNARIKDEIETPRTAMGGAHDFSVSFFVEAGGNDEYHAPDIAIGASKCHGLGIFIERGGDDSYFTSEEGAIGWAIDFDWNVGDCGNASDWPSYGFFVDLDGKDSYNKPKATAYGDNKSWINDDERDDTALELAGGLDTSEGRCYAKAYGSLWRQSP